ncbi:MAG: DNA internalization-related competence protein ComEC/Rec2 [Lactobacillales bacterium]|nr:DNA internalization-related competence protein ComEC/Rec2 [Lactobacillales bacterium]
MPLLLLSFVILSISFFAYDGGVASIVLTIFTIFRTVVTRNIKLISLSIVCFCLLGSLILYEKCSYQYSQSKIGRSEDIIVIQMATLKVEDDQISFIGKIAKKGKVMCFFCCKSKEEQQKWKYLKKPTAIRAKGELQLPEEQRNLNGFDYRKFLRGKKIALIDTIDSVSFIKHSLSSVGEMFSWMRFRMLERIRRVFPSPLNYYLEGLLFSYLDHEFSEDLARFQRLGIIHFFCLSGMHVFFFLRFFRFLLLRIGFTLETTFVLQILASFLYAGLAGFSVSLLRGLFQKNLEMFSRRYDLELCKQDCFFLSLFLGVCVNPYLLMTAGGQLSYGFGFASLFWQPITVTLSSKIGQNLVFSTGLSWMLLPLLWWHFFEWNPLSLILTCVLGWLFEHFLYSCFVFIFLVPIPIIINVLNFSMQFLNQFLKIVEELFPINWCVGKPSLFLLLFMWGIIFLSFHFLECGQYFLFKVASLFFIPFPFFISHPWNGCVMMVDVGQGDSLLVQEPLNRKVSLIDTGGRIDFGKNNKRLSNAQRTLIPLLKSRGIRTIDHLFLTHADADHCGDVDVLAENIRIRTIYIPAGAEKRESLRRKLQSISKKGTVIRRVLSPQKIDSFNLLSPRDIGNGENKDSLVLYRNIEGKKFLFTGDLEKEGEYELLKNYYGVHLDVLKVGHHGSRSSTSEEFLQAFSPNIAWISVGKKNRYSHPSAETLERLRQQRIYRTDKQGGVL